MDEATTQATGTGDPKVVTSHLAVAVNPDRVIGAAFEAGMKAAGLAHRVSTLQDAKPGDEEGLAVAVQKQGERIELLKDVEDELERRRPRPRRRAGVSHHQELDSFVDHINRHKSADSVVWAELSSMSMQAVFNYHAQGSDPAAAGWLDHRAVYECPRSRQWQEWTSRDGKSMRQDEFGDWIEQRLEDLTSGDKDKGFAAPAAVLQMARELMVVTQGRYERKLDPRTGASSLVCKTEHDATTSTAIPRAFMLGIPIFEGGEAYAVEARVRLSIEQGVGARFTYILHQRAQIERDAFGGIREAVRKRTELPLFAGRPEGDEAAE